MTRSQATLALLVCLATGVVTAAQKKTAPAKPVPKDAAADINTSRPDATHAVFETTEGTWMSVDVSPDGTTVVFDVLGDLYTVAVAGGTATPLTRGPAYDYHPRDSPDGKTIAFTSDENGMENLWLVDADGKNRRAITGERRPTCAARRGSPAASISLPVVKMPNARAFRPASCGCSIAVAAAASS